MNKASIIAGVGAALLAGSAGAGGLGVEDPREIQVRSVDFENGTIELHNFGALTIALDGWRFCTHDGDEARRYTAPGGFAGVSIEPGTSVVVHMNNDAPASSDAVNASTLGGLFASPLSPEAYGIQIYNPNSGGTVSFGDSSLIADALLWSVGGMPSGSAATRASQAVSEGLWTSPAHFISTSADSTGIELTDNGDGRLHGPLNYTVSAPCAADLTGDGQLDFFDLSKYLTDFGNMAPSADLTMDGSFDFFDLSMYLTLFSQGCPS